MTIFGRKVDNGEAVFAYQMTPFDQWDYDGINENMLTDMDVDGKKRKVLTHTSIVTASPMCSTALTVPPPRHEIRDDGLGREGRHEDGPSDQGA